MGDHTGGLVHKIKHAWVCWSTKSCTWVKCSTKSSINIPMDCGTNNALKETQQTSTQPGNQQQSKCERNPSMPTLQHAHTKRVHHNKPTHTSDIIPAHARENLHTPGE
jgi:hypothetical protein